MATHSSTLTWKIPQVSRSVVSDSLRHIYSNELEESVLTPFEKQTTLKDLAWWPQTLPVSCRRTRVGFGGFTR